MKNRILSLVLALFAFPIVSMAYEPSFEGDCYLAYDLKEGKILDEKGDCTSSSSPCSTFKIPLTLMGFDSGILKSEAEPLWSPPENADFFLEIWKNPHNPKMWLENSCVWFSQKMTTQMGMKTFERYVSKLEYGNRDVSGNPGKKDGLTESWLSSSLKISPKSQVKFIEHLLKNELQVSKSAQMKTKSLVPSSQRINNWNVYGKTGTGRMDEKQFQGWYIGWAAGQDVETSKEAIIFAVRVSQPSKPETGSLGGIAKEKALIWLKDLVFKKQESLKTKGQLSFDLTEK